MGNWFQAPLSFVIRYLFPGLVILLYYHLYDKGADEIFTAFSSQGKLILFSLTGVILYIVYRPLVYNPLIPRIQDFWRRKSDNYRTYLVKKYKPEYQIETKEAQFLYHEIKRLIDRPYSEEMLVSASCIHLLYMAGLSGILSSIVVAIIWLVGNAGNWWILLGIFFAGCILLIAGFFSDKYYETIELGIIKHFNDDEMNTIADRLLIKRKNNKVPS